jgi:hypothetical protein
MKTIGDGVCALARTIHLEEFERLRNLEILNTSLGNLNVDLEAFDFSAIHEAMWGAAPNLLQLLQQTLNPKQGAMPVEYKTKSKRYVVTVLAQLAQYRNSRTNFVQSIIALYLFASKVPKRVITSLNHIGFTVSYNCILEFLRKAAKHARQRLSQIAKSGKAFAVTFDNLTKMARVRDQRLFNHSSFLNMTAGFVTIPHVSRSCSMFEQSTGLQRTRIRELDVLTFLPSEGDHQIVMHCFKADIAKVARTMAKQRGVQPPPSLTIQRPTVFQIDHRQPTEVLPLTTYKLNEAITNDMIELLYSIQSEVGMVEQQCRERLVLFNGDYMTVKNIR